MEITINKNEYKVEKINVNNGNLIFLLSNNLHDKLISIELPYSAVDLKAVEKAFNEKEKADLEKNKAHYQAKLKEIESKLKALK